MFSTTPAAATQQTSELIMSRCCRGIIITGTNALVSRLHRVVVVVRMAVKWYLWRMKRNASVFVIAALLAFASVMFLRSTGVFRATNLSSRRSTYSTAVRPEFRNDSANIEISVELVGMARLGNLMFGHASMLGIADRNRFGPIVSAKNNKLIDTFNLRSRSRTIDRAAGGWHTCKEKLASGYDPGLAGISRSLGNIMLFGYFQSWKYFQHMRERIVKEFAFKKPIASRAAQRMRHVLNRGFPASTADSSLWSSVVWIGVHVRRGDMLEEVAVDQGYTVATSDYIERAMKYMERRLNGSRLLFVVISDEITWCKKNIRSRRLHPVEFPHLITNSAVDLAILASCNHTIITVGTFSWWAGYLAGGITVYYKDYPAPNSTLAETFRAGDYFHPSWIGLS